METREKDLCESSPHFHLYFYFLLPPVCSKLARVTANLGVKVTVDQLSTLTCVELTRFSSAASRKAHLLESPIGCRRRLIQRRERRREKERNRRKKAPLLLDLHYTTPCSGGTPEDHMLLFSAQQDRLEQTETVKVGQSARCVCVSLPSSLPQPPPPTGYPPLLSHHHLLLRIYPLSLLRPAQGSVCHGLPLRRQVSYTRKRREKQNSVVSSTDCLTITTQFRSLLLLFISV